MSKVLGIALSALLAFLLATTHASAQLVGRSSDVPRGLLESGERIVATGFNDGKTVGTLSGLSIASQAAARETPTGHRSWIARRPIWFGTMVGFAGGAVVGAARGSDNFADERLYVPMFGGIGAGFGAASGAIIGAVRK